ncbi:COMM domain-containing protein 6 isoform X2 [Aptenodytes patagonicus]|uniref:COMM domain-containing protein 6 isoform X2 n=1 Tax=Aptenodytes patagonicus TaxID=9234 RepID=UPI003F9EC110
MAAGSAVVLARALEALDVGGAADKINLIPQDFFAELCEQIIQHLNRKIPGVNTAELCQRIQTSGIEINVGDLAKIANIVSFLFSTAARNNLSTEELVTTLGNAVSALPKHAVQVIRHVWNEQGKSISMSEDARNMATVGQFVDIKWKLGVAMSSDTCRSLKTSSDSSRKWRLFWKQFEENSFIYTEMSDRLRSSKLSVLHRE